MLEQSCQHIHKFNATVQNQKAGSIANRGKKHGLLRTTTKTDHLVASSDEDGDSPGVVAFFNDQHTLLYGAKGQLTHHASFAQFLWRQLLKPRYDATPCGYCNQLEYTKDHFNHAQNLSKKKSTITLKHD